MYGLVDIKNFVVTLCTYWDWHDDRDTKTSEGVRSAVQIIEKLQNKVKNRKRFVMNMSDEIFPNGGVYVEEILNKYFEDFLVLTIDANYWYNPTNKVKYFPWYWYLNQPAQLHPVFLKTFKRPYILSCLNGRLRPQRIENFVKLKRRNFGSKIFTTIHASKEHQRYDKNFEFCENLTEDLFNEFLLYKEEFIEREGINDHSVNHISYRNSYVCLITETDISNDCIFVSEKSWKPFKTGQFPLILGNMYTIKFMRDLGFDVFDDYIDHSYDSEPDLHKRIDMIHDQIEKIMLYDWENIFEKTYERRKYNREYYYSQELLNKLITFDLDYWMQ